MTAYYNEFDKKAAAWLRELIKQGHIADGVVDERSIEDVRPDELTEFTQCHFFAGIGVWSYALRQAGWPDDRRVWTGSCPCQPFSAAGKGNGFADERHLWPAWFHLIQHGKPKDVPIFGEQVASKDGLAWLNLVQADLEGAGYASGAVDLCAAGVGAPHIRQRLFFVAEWMADTDSGECEGGTVMQEHERKWKDAGRAKGSSRIAACCEDDGLADTQHDGHCGPTADSTEPSSDEPKERLFDGRNPAPQEQPATGPTNGLWRDADWLFCRDGKWRPVESGTFPLAHGASARVGRLRGYGNAINAEVAKTFIEAYQYTRGLDLV